jgi:hypothetical protein
MFMAPDAINNAALSDTVTSGFAGVTGNTSAALNNLVGFADNTGSAFAKTPLTSVTGTNTEGMTGSVTPGALTNLTVFSTNTPFAYEFPGPLTTVTGDAEANLIIPPYSVTMAPLTGLASFCWAQGGNGGQVTAGTLSGLSVFSTNTPYAYEYPGALNGLVGYATDDTLPHGVFRGWFYDWESRGSSGYQLFAQGHQDDNIVYGFFGELSGYSLSAQGGAQYHGVYKTPYGLSASGTTTLFGEAYLQLVSYPHYPLLASGTGTQMGRAYLQTGGKYVVTAQGGAQYRGTYVTPYVVTATGHAGNLGEALLTLRRHRYVVTASGTQRNFGTVTGSLTGVAASNWGRGIMRGRFSLVASGHQPVTATYEGYSVTFIGDKEVPDAPDFATTRYTDFPFTALGRLGNAYYGVGPTGIFTMDEDTLPASAPIVSTFKTGEYDVGEPTLKRARSLWLGGRMNGAFSLDVTSSEIEDDTYSYTYALTGSRKYRMKVGRGIEATYLAYTISNTDGADFEINELSPEVDVLRRSA